MKNNFKASKKKVEGRTTAEAREGTRDPLRQGVAAGDPGATKERGTR